MSHCTALFKVKLSFMEHVISVYEGEVSGEDERCVGVCCFLLTVVFNGRVQREKRWKSCRAEMSVSDKMSLSDPRTIIPTDSDLLKLFCT